MCKLIKAALAVLLATSTLIIAFYLSTFVQTWWDSLDPGAQYVQPEIPDDMRLKVLRAVRYHGPMNKYRCDWDSWEFTCERDNGEIFDMFAYLEKENGN